MACLLSCVTTAALLVISCQFIQIQGQLAAMPQLQTNCTYLVALLGQRIQDGSSGGALYEFIVTNHAASAINVVITGIDGPIHNFADLATGEPTAHTFTDERALNGSEYSNKSLVVSSTQGPFLLQVFTIYANYYEGFLGYPLEAVMRDASQVDVYEYMVSTYCATHGYCQFAIAALQDETAVSVVFPSWVHPIQLCQGTYMFDSSKANTFKMMRYDSVQFESASDLTGTHIYSYEPIAVFAGSRNVSNGLGAQTRTSLTVEQLVPSTQWGTEFTIRPLGENGYGDILKLVSHWENTKVTMTGFPDMVITDKHHTIVRRLDKGMQVYIKADQPIQVMQISGVAQADGDTASLSMTYAPPTESQVTDITYGCPSITNTTGSHIHFVTVTASLDNVRVNNASDNTDEKMIPYTRLSQAKQAITAPETTLEVNVTEGDVGLTGILQCGEFATMPLLHIHNHEPLLVREKPLTTVPDNAGLCVEGKRYTYYFDKSNSPTNNFITTDIDGWAPDTTVLKLRIRACGETVVELTSGVGARKKLYMKISNSGILATTCSQSNCNTAQAIESTGNGLANVCGGDMLFYWFRLISDVGQKKLCIGDGPVADKTVNCTGEDTATIDIASFPTSMRVGGLFTTADFIYDIEALGGCVDYNSGFPCFLLQGQESRDVVLKKKWRRRFEFHEWRCHDRIANCSEYGQSFCNDPDVSMFAESQCAKHCGKCFADSFGREFRVVLPAALSSCTPDNCFCHMYVTPMHANTLVAVWVDIYIPNSPSTRNVVTGLTTHEQIRMYDCREFAKRRNILYIYTDADVSVNIVYKNEAPTTSYTAYPVDSHATEFMIQIPLVTGNSASRQMSCFAVSLYDNIQVTTYHASSDKKVSADPVGGPRPENIPAGQRSKIEGVMLEFNWRDVDSYGMLFVFDRPSAMFCGRKSTTLTDNEVSYQYQVDPLNTWDTHFKIPEMSETVDEQPFVLKLQFMSSVDNTVITISGGLDAQHVLRERGSFGQQDIDPLHSYTVISSHPISLGLHFSDSTHIQKNYFFNIPPLTSFLAGGFYAPIALGQVAAVNRIKTFYINDQDESRSRILGIDSELGGGKYWNSSSGTGFGFSIVYTEDSDWIVIPGYTMTFPVIRDDTCRTSKSTVMDGKDNDCDRLTDEDVCLRTYGVYADVDIDGDFGEDCASVYSQHPATIPLPVTPVCFISTKPDSQCWTTCMCKCEWVQQLKAYENMTQAEKEEDQVNKTDAIKANLTINTTNLAATVKEKVSAEDSRQSAANIGYLGISLFAVTFGLIFILDITSLIRDGRILVANLQEGFQRLSDFFC